MKNLIVKNLNELSNPSPHFEVSARPHHIQRLSQELSRRKKKNPRYSLRAFAHALNLDPSALSRILAGKQEISLLTTRKVVKALKLPPEEKILFLTSVAEEKKRKITSFLHENLEAGNEMSLESTSLAMMNSHSVEVNQSPIYFSVDADRVHVIQKMLRAFLKELSKFILPSSKSQVYELKLHLMTAPCQFDGSSDHRYQNETMIEGNRNETTQ